MARRRNFSRGPEPGHLPVRQVITALGCFAALLRPVPATAITGDTEGAFGLDGSLRTITTATYNYRAPLIFGDGNRSDGLAQMLLRLTAGGHPIDWLSYELHTVQDLTMSTVSASGVSLLGSSTFSDSAGEDLTYRALDTDWRWADEEDVEARLWLDRFNVKLVLPAADITLGRQAITFGKAYFWNPLDVFFAFQPYQFDRDYKGGVDALRIDLPLGDFSGLNLVGVPGRNEGTLGGDSDFNWDSSALLARAFTTVYDWDVAAQGGKILGGYQLGAALSGELGSIEARVEAAYFWPESGAVIVYHPPQTVGGVSIDLEVPEHHTAVVGVGRFFESSLHLEGEYLYNGAGDLPLWKAFALMAQGRILHASRHLAGVVGSYELTPLLRGSLAYLYSFSDGSTLLQPGLIYSAADEVELLAGALLAFGSRPLDYRLRSEFGTYPHVFYVESKIYF